MKILYLLLAGMLILLEKVISTNFHDMNKDNLIMVQHVITEGATAPIYTKEMELKWIDEIGAGNLALNGYIQLRNQGKSF